MRGWNAEREFTAYARDNKDYYTGFTRSKQLSEVSKELAALTKGDERNTYLTRWYESAEAGVSIAAEARGQKPGEDAWSPYRDYYQLEREMALAAEQLAAVSSGSESWMWRNKQLGFLAASGEHALEMDDMSYAGNRFKEAATTALDLARDASIAGGDRGEKDYMVEAVGYFEVAGDMAVPEHLGAARHEYVRAFDAATNLSQTTNEEEARHWQQEAKRLHKKAMKQHD